jgi:hypothetical protein
VENCLSEFLQLTRNTIIEQLAPNSTISIGIVGPGDWLLVYSILTKPRESRSAKMKDQNALSRLISQELEPDDIEVVIMMNEDRTSLSHPSYLRTEHIRIASNERPSASLRGTSGIKERPSS